MFDPDISFLVKINIPVGFPLELWLNLEISLLAICIVCFFVSHLPVRIGAFFFRGMPTKSLKSPQFSRVPVLCPRSRGQPGRQARQGKAVSQPNSEGFVGRSWLTFHKWFATWLMGGNAEGRAVDEIWRTSWGLHFSTFSPFGEKWIGSRH